MTTALSICTSYVAYNQDKQTVSMVGEQAISGKLNKPRKEFIGSARQLFFRKNNQENLFDKKKGK